MSRHDHSYRLLFSQPDLVADLLRGYVHAAWIGELDLSTLTPVKTDFISQSLVERRSDCLWRVKWQGRGGDRWLYVYLMLEFQSRPDHWMPVRTLTYLSLLYQNLIRSGDLQRGDSLPPVLPLVLYNGRKPWVGPVSLGELLPEVPEGLRSYLPQHQFLLIDETDYRGSPLPEDRNLAAALFRLEYSMTSADITAVLGRLLQWLDHDQQRETRKAFASWMKHVLLPERMKGLNLEGMNELEEMHSMLEETVKEWRREATRKGLAQGRQEGRQEGREEGRQEGRHAGIEGTLRKQIELKYGAIPQWADARIAQASDDQLDQWVAAILSADTLQELLGEQ